ncbi:MAG: FtsX-like permease family protein, partial [Cyclobacteriaceae bacterium]
QDPIGQTITFFWGNPCKVVGVVKNHHFNSLTQPITPQLFIRKPDENFGTVFIRLSGDDMPGALAHIEKTFKSQFPDYTYSYRFREDENVRQYESEARWNKIILVSSILTVLISCVGLLGLAALSAERRAKEVGVRKVLGASVASITQLLSFNFLVLVVVSFVVAVPAAWWATGQWLNTYAYHVDFGVRTVALTMGITVGVSLITVGSLAIRTALANPAGSLKTE